MVKVDFFMRKGMDVSSAFTYMIGALVMVILLFTWFFPTLNGANALNNSSTLTIGGSTYNWVVPLVVILIIISVIMYFFKSSQLT